MPKMKTKRGARKRLKRTGSGKLKRAGGWKQHKLEGKDPKRRRRLRRRFGDLPSSLCCFQPPARISLPDAVRFSRLRAPRFVFIFGMISPVIEERHGSAAAFRAYGGMGAMSGPHF